MRDDVGGAAGASAARGHRPGDRRGARLDPPCSGRAGHPGHRGAAGALSARTDRAGAWWRGYEPDRHDRAVQGRPAAHQWGADAMSRVEQIDDEVYVLSDVEPADSERSWLPADTKGFEPFNKYVIVKQDAVLLLETGVAAHYDSVLASLRDIVGDRKLVILPTRSELESIGNLGAIID